MTGLLLNDLLFGVTSGLLYSLITLIMPTWIIPKTLYFITPSATFRASHLNTLAIAAQSALIAGLLFSALARVTSGRVDILVAGCTAALVYAAAASLGSGFFSWIYFRICHLWLATCGRLPWRLYAFLDDAHRRGVLRQTGTSWRFRHAIVQDHLARKERVARLRLLAAGGHAEAAASLANLFSEMGHGDEAIAIMKTVADDAFMGREKLAGLLGIHGRMDDLAALADDGDTDSAWVLADQLLGQRKREEAIAVLWTCATRADTTNIGTRVNAASRLTELLAEEGRIDELRTLADNGNLGGATWKLADLLAERGQIDEAITILRSRESDDNQFAGWKLSNLFAKYGRIADLQFLADSGNDTAFARYIEVLGEQGKTDEAIAVLRTHARELFIDRKLASLLAKQGRDDEAIAVLRTYPEDPFAAIDLAELLAERNQVDDAVAALSPHVSKEMYAVRALAKLLTDHGRADEAVALLNSIISKRPVYRRKQSTRYLDYLMKIEQNRREAAHYLAGLLAQLGRIDDLRLRASKGDQPAGIQLASLLAAEGRFDEAIALVRARADNGDAEAKEKLAELLAECGRNDEAIAILQALADTGNRYARKLLINLRSKLESDG
jgi:thioredoxin-like negative regulator of GroEL